MLDTLKKSMNHKLYKSVPTFLALNIMWPITCAVTPSPDSPKWTTLLKWQPMGALVELLTMVAVGMVLLQGVRTEGAYEKQLSIHVFPFFVIINFFF
jgi:hypothetical protein